MTVSVVFLTLVAAGALIGLSLLVGHGAHSAGATNMKAIRASVFLSSLCGYAVFQLTTRVVSWNTAYPHKEERKTLALIAFMFVAPAECAPCPTRSDSPISAPAATNVKKTTETVMEITMTRRPGD